MDLNRADMKRFLELNEIEELRNDAYINSNIAKQRLKRWHDKLVSRKEFQKGQRVLLYDSKFHIFPGKLKLSYSTVPGVSKSMANVSSHSWSHFLETRRKSTSLNHIKLEKTNAPTVPSSKGGVPSSPPQRRYLTRRPPTSPPPEPLVHRIPPKRARTSGPGETSRHAQPNSQGPADSQHPSGIAPEAIIKRPMVTSPPIEGNSYCRARPFHSELYFDIEAMRQ
ncbi:hypothetical protein AAG906_035824 [Vitis piasezkii]